MSTMKKIQKVRIPDGKGGIREIVDVEVDVELDEVTGEYFLTDEAIRKIDRVKARLMGLLLPSEIKELRMRFDKTQADMCAILALGAKTWTRWETGAERPQPFYGKVLIALYEGRQTLEDFCAQRGKCRMWLNQTEKTCYSCSGLPEQLVKISNDITGERSDEDEAGDIQAVA